MRAIVAAGLNSSSTLQCFDVRPDDGTLLSLGEVVHAGMQTMYAAASPELPIVYVVDINGVKDPVRGRDEQGLLKSWAVSSSGSLELLSSVPSGGITPCHNAYVSGEQGEGDVLVVANYGDETSNVPGNLALFPVFDSGELSAPIIRTVAVPRRAGGSESTVTSAVRQTVAHPHMVLADPSGEVIYAVDLGANAVVGYQLSRAPFGLSAEPVVVCRLHVRFHNHPLACV